MPGTRQARVKRAAMYRGSREVFVSPSVWPFAVCAGSRAHRFAGTQLKETHPHDPPAGSCEPFGAHALGFDPALSQAFSSRHPPRRLSLPPAKLAVAPVAQLTFTDLGALSGVCTSSAQLVNQNGGVAGTASNAHGFYWTNAGGMVDIGTLGGSDSIAYGLNDGGKIVGSSRIAGSDAPYHAFLWTAARGMSDLGTLPGDRQSFARAISALAHVTGYSESSSGCCAFLWSDGGGMIDIGSPIPGSPATVGLAVNDSGEVTGLADDASFTKSQAFFWSAGTGALPIDVLPGARNATPDRHQLMGDGRRHEHHEQPRLRIRGRGPPARAPSISGTSSRDPRTGARSSP